MNDNRILQIQNSDSVFIKGHLNSCPPGDDECCSSFMSVLCHCATFDLRGKVMNGPFCRSPAGESPNRKSF